MDEEYFTSGDPSEFVQCICGGVWFEVLAAFELGSRMPTATGAQAQCIECGTVITPGGPT